MRAVVVGAGAIGGVVGARLARAGHDVLLIARGTHGVAIARDGLRLRTPDEELILHIPVAPAIEAAVPRADDVLLLCVKGQDTAAAVDALARVWPRATPIACLQNGVANERTAATRFERVIPVHVMCPTTYLVPGVVEAPCTPVTGLLDVGPGGEALAAAFRASTFRATVRADVMRWKYAKLISNLANAVEAAVGLAGRGLAIARAAQDEGRACLTAAGIPWASDAEVAALDDGWLVVRPIGGVTRPGGSSWQSLARGTGSIEAAYLNGEIVALGAAHGVATPVNAGLLRVAQAMASSHTPPGTFTEAALLAAVAG